MYDIEKPRTQTTSLFYILFGSEDFLRERETGLFCEVRHPESIALAVKQLHEMIRDR